MASLTAGWKVELQMGDPSEGAPGLYDTALYDTDVYGSDEPTAYLLDVTARCEGLKTSRGRRKFTGRFKTGSVELLLDNQDGAFTEGTPPLGVLSLRPGRSIRVTYNSAAVFFGYVDTMSDVHGTDGAVRLRVQGYDAFSNFNVNNKVAVAGEGAGELAPQRYSRLLGHYLEDFQLSLLSLQEWAETLQATTMGQNLLTELQITADSEGGGCWMGVSGAVVATQRDYFTDRALEDPEWTVGGASPIGLRKVGTIRSMQRIITEAHMARNDGAEQVAVNVAAIGLFGRRTHTRLDLVNDNDTSVAELAQRLVEFAGVDRLRLTDMTFIPEPESETAMFCTSANFGDVALVTVNTLDGWASTSRTQIFGVEHDVGPEVWTCTMFVDDSVFAPSNKAFDENAFSDGFS